MREQKDLLDVAESFDMPQERKDSKRSDPGVKEVVTIRRNVTAERKEQQLEKQQQKQQQQQAKLEEENLKQQQQQLQQEEVDEREVEQQDNQQSGSQKKDNLKKYSVGANSQQTREQRKREPQQLAQKPKPVAYDKTLLIPQERYKSTLPKIIITASASVSANGKKLNYSLGNVLSQSQGAELKIPPHSYDDYKEEDVVLDPFFQDVPKINKKH